MDVRLGDGADSLDLDHLRVTGALTVTGATGSDTVRVGNVAVLGTTTIDTGLGTDTVRLERETRLTGLLTVLLGDGDDTLTVRGPQAAVQDRFVVTFVTGTSSPGVFEPDRPVAELSLGDVSIKAGAGSDVVEVIGPARIRGDLFVDLGGGAVDRFDVTEGDVEELLFIRFADATLNANVVQQYSPHLFGDVEVSKSGGTANVNVIGAPDVRDDDFVDLATFAGAEPELFPVFVAGATRIKLSQTDAADVTLRLATFAKDVFVQTGKLGDTVALDTVGYGGSVTIRTGTGDDDVRARNIRAGGGDAGTVDVRTEAGADTVHLDGIDARRRIGVDTGDGADSVMLNLVHSDGELVVSTGRQDDTVIMLGSSARFRLFADLGAGDDELEFKNLSFEGVGTLMGGTGTDTLVRRLLSLPFAGTVVDFE